MLIVFTNIGRYRCNFRCTNSVLGAFVCVPSLNDVYRAPSEILLALSASSGLEKAVFLTLSSRRAVMRTGAAVSFEAVNGNKYNGRNTYGKRQQR